MKKIEAVIRPFKLDEVKRALGDEGVDGMTVSEVQLGRQKGIGDLEREPEASGEFLPRVKVEVLIDDARCRSVAELIRETAATGRVGDGRVVIVDVDQAVRIRTGERGTLAL